MRPPLMTLMIAYTLAGLAARAVAGDEPADLRLRTYEAQQADIKALNDSGKHPVKSYALAKAQCWLDVSFHEYTRNDRSAFPAQAWTQSHRITDELKASGESATARETPLINGATRLRPDLWAKLDGLKNAEGFACAQALVACAEVELVHAGNEFRQIGWRHAKPYVQIAEDQVADASNAAGNCAATSPQPAEGAAAAPAAVQTEHVSIGAAALFRFDRREPKDLLPRGRAKLDALAAEIAQHYASVDIIRLVGHTDRLGARAYNEKLALDRAITVREYLQSKGVAGSFQTSGAGSEDSLTLCHGAQRSAELHRCLQPDRRVDLVIVGIAG